MPGSVVSGSVFDSCVFGNPLTPGPYPPNGARGELIFQPSPFGEESLS